jgi:hypothetical protein
LQGDYVKGLSDEEQAKLGDPAGADVELAVGMKVYVKWPGSSEEGGSDDVFRAMVVAHKPPKTKVEDAGACETLHILRPWLWPTARCTYLCMWRADFFLGDTPSTVLR